MPSMGTQQLFWLGLAAGVLALLFALFQAKRVLSFSEGTDAMKKIASAIREGADAYLRHQYATVFKVFAVVSPSWSCCACSAGWTTGSSPSPFSAAGCTPPWRGLWA